MSDIMDPNTVQEVDEEWESEAATSGDTGLDEEEEDDGEPKICHVCGDQATGYHFNAMTCEGCKGFFRRAMKRSVHLSCPFQRSCVITKNNRRQCQACRLTKCLDIGMRKELIMTDEAVENRRALIKRKKLMRHMALPAAVETGLTGEQQLLIQELTEAQNQTFDRSFSHFRHFRPVERSSRRSCSTTESFDDYVTTSYGQIWREGSGGSSPEDHHLSHRQQDVRGAMAQGSFYKSQFTENTAGHKVFCMLPHISDLSTYMIKGVISFAKVLAPFRELSIEDQIALLKGATFELTQIRFNTLFNPTTGLWECGKLEYDINDASLAGFKALLLDPLLKFHYILKKLNLQNEEYSLMQAISLFSPDRTGVKHSERIDQLQETYALALKTYIDTKRPQHEKFLFPKIIRCLTELRSMNVEYCKQIVEIHDIQPDNSPLIMEVFSRGND